MGNKKNLGGRQVKSPIKKQAPGIPVAFQDTILLEDLEAKPEGKIAYKNLVEPLGEGIQLRASIWIQKSALSTKDFQKAVANKKAKDLLKGARLEAVSKNNKTVYKLS